LANVQIDDGDFTRIANEILEQLAKIRLNGTQHAIVLVIWRYTYGFNRTSHELSLGFLEKATGINRKQIGRELTKLVERDIITIEQEAKFNQPQVLKFNKDYDCWVSAKTLTGSEKVEETGSELVDPPVSELVDQERQSLKTIKKDNVVPFEEIKDNFNHICESLPKVIALSDSRKDKLRTRWRELKTLDRFIELFTVVEDTPFLKGDNPREWIATFDWLIENDKNYMKVLEGQYKRQRAPTKKQREVYT